MYNVSRSPSVPILDDYYWYPDKISAQDAAVAEARASGDDWYVLEITVIPVFKAVVTMNVTTEVM